MKKILSMVFTFCILLSLSSQAFAIQVEIPSEPIEEVESVVTVNDLGSEGDFVGCFEPIIIRLPIDDQAAPASETSTTRDYVEFSIRAGIKKSDGKNYTWVYNVDCDALIKPSIDVTAELYGEFTDGSGTFEEIATDNIRPCLKNVKTPRRWIFFRCVALKILEIHKVFLRIFALPSEKISYRWAFRHLSNKA